jgi:Zn-dependent protease
MIKNTGLSELLSSTNFGILSILLKFGAKLGKPLSALLKGGKATKVFLGGASFGVYSVLLSWEFALLILVSIGIHEMGHLWAMRKMGMETKGFYFIPLLGGAAVPEEDFPSHWAEAFIAAMGPVVGMIPGFFTGVLYLQTGTAFFSAATAWIALINLVNLLPVKPLDGGRIWSGIAFSFERNKSLAILGALGIGSLVIGGYFGFGLIYLIAPIGLVEIWFQYVSQIRQLRPNEPLAVQKIVGKEYSIKETKNTDIPFRPSNRDAEELFAVLSKNFEDAIHRLTLFSSDWRVIDVSQNNEGVESVTVAVTEDPTGRTPHFTLISEDFRSLLRDKHIGISKPPMSMRRVGITVCIYFTLVAVIGGFMYITQDVAGADAALRVLR